MTVSSSQDSQPGSSTIQNETRDFDWQQVETFDSIAYALFKEQFLNRNIPLIITNSVSQWPAVNKWTPDYLKQKLGDKLMIPNADYYQVASKEGKTYPFDELMKLIEASSEQNPSPYLRNIDLYSYLPELVEDITPRLTYASPNWLTCKLVPQVVTDNLVELFIGGKGTGFPQLHFDTHGSNAFITQVYGTKEVFLFSPEQTETLSSLFGKPQKFSLEKLKAISTDNNPVAAKLVGYKQTLSPGDTVFVPAGWWHITTMNGVSISLSTNNVNQANWIPFIRSMTDYNHGAKKTLKIAYFLAVGCLLWVLDRIGLSGLISRPVNF